jgi:hypothetical protein
MQVQKVLKVFSRSEESANPSLLLAEKMRAQLSLLEIDEQEDPETQGAQTQKGESSIEIVPAHA